MTKHSIDRAQVFAVGTHNGITIAQSDLDHIVASFAALEQKSRVPLKFGHNAQQAITDGQPALGWVERVWTEGGKLLAKFVDIPGVVYNAIREGLYKHVSVELLQNFSRDGARYPWVLEAVALLGADRPAVGSLQDLQTLTMSSKLPRVRFEKLVAFTLDQHISGVQNQMTDAERIAELERKNAQLLADKKASDDALAAEKQRQFKEKVEARRVEIKTTLEAAVAEGRINPVARERVLNSRQFKSDEDVVDYWNKESLDAEIKGAQLSTFKEGAAKKPDLQSRTNMQEEGAVELEGKKLGEVVTFKAQAEAKRMGQDPLNPDHLSDATKRLFKQEPLLGKAYFADPQAEFHAADFAPAK